MLTSVDLATTLEEIDARDFEHRRHGSNLITRHLRQRASNDEGRRVLRTPLRQREGNFSRLFVDAFDYRRARTALQ